MRGNSDNEIRRLERLARAGDIDALGGWLEWAIREQDRETVRLIESLAEDFVNGYGRSKVACGIYPEALKRIRRTGGEWRHGLPRGSMVDPMPTSPGGVLRAQVCALMAENDCSAADAAELIWVNARDDGMREYFQGTPLDSMTMADLEALLDNAVVSIDGPSSDPRRNAEARRIGDGRERAECRECGWVGPVRSGGTGAASEAMKHRCLPRGDRDPLCGGGADHSCGGRHRRSELSSAKIASGLWEIACSACGDRWDYDNAEVDEPDVRRNSDEEVRRLEREASADMTPETVSRLARAYARAGLIEPTDVWVVEHQRFRGGRSRWELVDRMLVGVYSSSIAAQTVAASIAVRDRWKLRNRDVRRAFAEAEAAADLGRMIHVYSMGSYYKLLVERVRLDAPPLTRSGFDRENWTL